MSCDWLEPQRSRMTKSLSSSGVSSCYSEMDVDHLNEDGSDEEDAFISFTTMESRCDQLYQEGLELKHCGEYEPSLQIFLKCLEGMQECQYFVKLPQTLHQLSVVSRSLQDLQGAEEYEKAEKLFYEATAVDSPQTKEGGMKHKKRKPFSKRPKPTMSVCNPAEYGNILIKKSDDHDRLARACAKDNKFSDALDHCSKAVSIKQCIFGRNHHSTLASMDYLAALHTEASIFEASTDGVGGFPPPYLHLKGDLSPEHTVQRNENGSSQSAQCGGAEAHLLATRLGNGTPQCTLSSTAELHPPNDSFAQTETAFPLLGRCNIVPVQDETPAHSSNISKVTQDVGKSDKDSDRQECTWDSIHKDSRQDRAQWASGLPGKSQEIVCVNVKHNLGKLSELKNPMCVNLDLHKGHGEGTENTRCLPLWVLLLPAFLALVGYYTFYYS